MNELKDRIIEQFTLGADKEKHSAVFDTDGPTLIIAGPGTGKTYTLVLRALYLMISERAKPSEIVLTTFTEKASYELRDRLSSFSRSLNVKLNLHELVTGTIHSICDRFISKYRHHTLLNKNYIVLDELTNSLFINEHFDKIVQPFYQESKYFGKWTAKWTTIKYLKKYFDKITEELIAPELLAESSDTFIAMLGQSYQEYKNALFANNRVDFSFQQRIFYDLLQIPEIREKISSSVKYMLIDEYQDTNYIQEQIALLLVNPHNNLTVVGDEDQALYRFRGATVRNILEFENHFPNLRKVRLLENYRSHETIIDTYNSFIQQVDWKNPKGKNHFRHEDKEVVPAKSTISPDYPAVFCIWTNNKNDEALRFADMVSFLLENKVIADPSDVALLLSSVKLEHSAHYIKALHDQNIKVFCPRARAFFENEEVRFIISCFALIFGFVGSDLDDYEFKDTIEDGLKILKDYLSKPIQAYLERMHNKIQALENGQSIDEHPLDIVFQLFAYEPFTKYLENENSARNLSQFTSLINAFMSYYHISVVTAKNKTAIKNQLFYSYFRMLFNTGQNEFEDENNPIPKGYVQIMTIHQSKGLEFPVVVVGSLDKRYSVSKIVDDTLIPFYTREAFEPREKITGFDHARHFYVAFSRPEKLLVLTASQDPKDIFSSTWEGLDQWPYVKKETLKAQQFRSKDPFKPKKSYSLTSHINVYETCPQQYLFYKEYGFTPSRTGQILFGLLVHETIEDLHRKILEREKVDENIIGFDFERNYKGMLASGHRALGILQKEVALKHVIRYYQNNKDLLGRVVETEVDVSFEKEEYIINGKVDLLMGRDEKLELLDFKSQHKPEKADTIWDKYIYQLHVYAHILKERYKKEPERLFIYWTGEENRKDALTEISYDAKKVDEAGDHFDHVVKSIMNKDFKVNIPPNKDKICIECDFKYYCQIKK
ncbi:MAG TPA: ATP-dependent DNA helicase [Caldisericia bacterium]|nr:ATP-dependent DNA helicase [Caldisericia bacterium]